MGFLFLSFAYLFVAISNILKYGLWDKILKYYVPYAKCATS